MHVGEVDPMKLPSLSIDRPATSEAEIEDVVGSDWRRDVLPGVANSFQDEDEDSVITESRDIICEPDGMVNKVSSPLCQAGVDSRKGDSQSSPLRQAGEVDFQPSSDQLFIELAELATKHHVERTKCLENWLRRQDSDLHFMSSRPQDSVVKDTSKRLPRISSRVCYSGSPCLSPTTLSCSSPWVDVVRAKKTPDHSDASPTQLKEKAFSRNCVQKKASDPLHKRPNGESPSEPPTPSSEPVTSISRRSNRSSLLQKGASTMSSYTKKKRRKPAKANFTISTKMAQTVRKTRLQRFTTSRVYELASGVLIGVNAACIGWQVQWSSEHARDDARHLVFEDNESDVFRLLAIFFNIAFSIELGLRWVADGFLEFFRSDEVGWCVFDVVIVGVGLLEFVISLFVNGESVGSIASGITLLRVLRVMRVVKVLRVIRVMKFFRELRMMIWSIMGSLKSLLWVMLVLGLLFFCFGIVLTQGAELYLSVEKGWHDPNYADLQNSFGTLDLSILSLFMAMSGGNDWSLYYQALKPLPMQYSLLFLVFITFSIFAVVNIVTGVFVQSALESNNHDREIVVHEELESKKEYCEAMRQFFEEIDEDGTGRLTFDEFEGKLDDERVVAYFNALKLDVSDAVMLFNLLDCDHSGEIQIDEFLLGCYKLQGESRNLDMKVMQLEVKWLREAFFNLTAALLIEDNELASNGSMSRQTT